MKVLHVVPTYLPAVRYGGPIHSVHGLCKALAEHGLDVSVYTTRIDGQQDSDVETNRPRELDGVKVTYFDSKVLRRLYYAPQMKLSLARNIDSFDVVHGHSIYLWPTTMASRLCRKRRLPYVLSPRGMLVKTLVNKKNRLIKTLWIKMVEKKNIETATTIHFTSNSEEDDAKAFGFTLRDTFVLPNGIDIKETVSFSGAYLIAEVVESCSPYVLYIGRLNWKKGLDRLIEAMRFTSNVTLVIAGYDEQGYKRLLSEFVSKHGLGHRVRFLDPVDDLEKYYLLKNAELFLLTSYSENFGNVVLEAMAAGCPVVVSKKVGLADTVKKEGAGIVVGGDPRDIAGAMNALLADKVAQREMSIRGRKTAEAHFSWGQIARQMMLKYQEIVNKS